MSIESLIDEVLQPPPSRGRKPRHDLQIAYVRELNDSDVKALWDVPEGGMESTRAVTRIRQRHHYLARLLAEGRPNPECGLLTGLDPAYISKLRSDPAIIELVEYYKTQVEEVFINVHERLATLGMDSVAELNERLDTNPEKFTARELMELASLGLDRAGYGPQSKITHSHVSSLPADTLARLKNELTLRHAGEIRTLTQSNPGTALGPVIEHEPLGGEETPAPRGQGKGTGI